MELVFVLAVVALALIVVPVVAPHVGIIGGIVCQGVALKFVVRAFAAPAVPPGEVARFSWNLELPIAAAVALYGLLWIGIGLWSLRAERAAELDLDPAASLA